MAIPAETISRYCSFRPLGMPSPFFPPRELDGQLADAIVAWASKILLGGHAYDLRLNPKDILQVQSNLVNRHVYMAVVPNRDLLQTIASESRRTEQSQRECSLQDAKYIVGLLFLKRHFFRGTQRYGLRHPNRTDWYVEDRYHLDIYFSSKEQPESQVPAATSAPRRRVLRVYPDSAGCLNIPSFRFDPDAAAQNDILASVPTYMPAVHEIIMSWHEVAAYLGLQHTGVYALCNFIAEEVAVGRHYRIAEPFFWGRAISGGLVTETDLNGLATLLWQDSGGGLPPGLTATYDSFFLRTEPRPIGLIDPTEPGPVHSGRLVIDTYSRTPLFGGPLGEALVDFLTSQGGGLFKHLGRGLFLARLANPTQLAAGNGNWGSGETAGVDIVIQEETDSSVISGDDSYGLAAGEIAVDLVRYFKEDEIVAELQACASSVTMAECEVCVEDSLADTLDDWSTAADIVDAIGGIVACLLFAPICGLSLAVTVNALKDLFSNDSPSLGEELCYGLPQGPQSETGGPCPEQRAESLRRLNRACRRPMTVYLPRPSGNDAEARAICRSLSGDTYSVAGPHNGWVLTDAYPWRCGEAVGTHCIYCPPTGPVA